LNKEKETVHSIAAQLQELQRQVDELTAEQMQFEQKRRGHVGATAKERQAYHDGLAAMSADELDAHIEECRQDRERERKLATLVAGLKLNQERLRARMNEILGAEAEPEVRAAQLAEQEAIEAFKEAEANLNDATARREALESRRRSYLINQRRHEAQADEQAIGYGLLLNAVAS
jgi:hypothetical protein